MSAARPFKVGVTIHPQQCTVQELRDAWRRADDLGVDSIWFWDHFYPLSGDPSGAHFTPGNLNYSLSGASSSIHHTLLEKSDGRFYLAIWQEVPSFNVTTKSDLSVPPVTVQLKFDHPVREAKIYRPLQGADPATDQQSVGSLSVSVPDEAIIVEITP